MVMTRALILALLTVVASSAVAAGDGPEEVIRALYKGSPALGAQRTQPRQSRCAVEIFQSRTNQVVPKECAAGAGLSQGRPLWTRIRPNHWSSGLRRPPRL